MADVFIGTEALETGLPFITNRFPAPGASAVLVGTSVSFTVLDDVGGAGIDVNSIDVAIGGVDAVIDGVIQPGFSGSITPNGNGFDVLVTPDVPLPGSTLVSVDVFVADLATPPNTLNDSWSFTTEFVAVSSSGPSRWQWRYMFGWQKRGRSFQ